MSDRHLIDLAPRGFTVVATFFSPASCGARTVYSFGAFRQSMADDFGTGKGSTAVIFGLTTFSFFG